MSSSDSGIILSWNGDKERKKKPYSKHTNQTRLPMSKNSENQKRVDWNR